MKSQNSKHPIWKKFLILPAIAIGIAISGEVAPRQIPETSTTENFKT
jgi:hypothetical protein